MTQPMPEYAWKLSREMRMSQIRYFDSQVFEPGSEIAQNEAEARGSYVRAFIDEHDSVYKVEVVRDRRVAEVIYHGATEEHEAELLHQAAYPGVPFQTVCRTVMNEGAWQQRKQRYDAHGEATEVVIETLDERDQPLVEVRQNREGVVTSRREYEYNDQGDIARAREYDGQGRLVDEYEAGE